MDFCRKQRQGMETCQHLQMLPKASWKLARWEALGRQLEVVPVPAGQTAAQAAAQTAGSGGWHLSEEVKRWEQDINESYHKLETLKEAWSKSKPLMLSCYTTSVKIYICIYIQCPGELLGANTQEFSSVNSHRQNLCARICAML